MNALFMEQLKDGCYHVILDYYTPNGTGVHYEWVFQEVESNAEPDEYGLRLCLRLIDK